MLNDEERQDAIAKLRNDVDTFIKRLGLTENEKIDATNWATDIEFEACQNFLNKDGTVNLKMVVAAVGMAAMRTASMYAAFNND